MPTCSMGWKPPLCAMAPEQEQVISIPPAGGSSRIAAAFSVLSGDVSHAMAEIIDKTLRLWPYRRHVATASTSALTAARSGPECKRHLLVSVSQTKILKCTIRCNSTTALQQAASMSNHQAVGGKDA